MGKLVKLSVAKASKELKALLETPAVVLQEAKVENIVAEPTFSKTDRFLACQWWVGREAAPEAFEEVDVSARYGSAFHEIMCARFTKRHLFKKTSQMTPTQAAKKWSVDGDIDARDLKSRVDAAEKAVRSWLKVHGWTDAKFEFETSFAYNIVTGDTRRCAPHDDRHVYPDRRPNEICGAVDLAALRFRPRSTVEAKELLVLDYKSGFLIQEVEKSGQLKTIGLALGNFFGATSVTLGLVHAPAIGSVDILVDEFELRELGGRFKHGDALANALTHIGDGSLRPTEHCKWCPALAQCPAHTSALAEMRGSSSLVIPEDVGRAHQKLTQFRSQFRQYDELIARELRQWVKKNGPAPRPDGQSVDLVERPYSNLSQLSIIRALGELHGKREIERLRKLGCIEEGRRPELRATKR